LLAGKYDWAEVTAGSVKIKTRNVIDLCRYHHRQLTDNESWVEFNVGHEQFFWRDKKNGSWETVGPLRFDVDESLYCPECGQRKHVKKEESFPREKRKRKTLAITVPDDLEDGAEVFDTLVESLCDELGYEGARGLARYHAAIAAMGFTLVNVKQFHTERAG